MPETRLQQAPGLVDVLADLDVIGRVESMGQARGIDSLEQVIDARGRISIDSFLVLEQQRHAPALCPPRQLLHPGDDLVAVCRGILAGRDVKAEDPDPGRLVEIREVQGPAESQEMIVERLGDPYLANRRAQGAEAKASRTQQTPKASCCSSSRSSTLVPWMARNSMFRIPCLVRTSICSRGSWEISSAKALRRIIESYSSAAGMESLRMIVMIAVHGKTASAGGDRECFTVRYDGIG